MWGKKLSLKRKLSSPTPLSSKKLQLGGFLFLDTVRSTVKPPMFALHPRLKVFVHLFQKVARVWGE